MVNSAGRHLILDGYVKDSSVFTAEKLTLLFQNLADALEMKILQGPTFLEVELDESKLTSNVFQDEGGITGSCIISTSHMALHAWPIRKFLSLDVFSCKDFDVKRAMSIINEHMGLSSINVMNLDRSKPQAPKE
jgi:S-adenosylmethionine decarboxylase